MTLPGLYGRGLPAPFVHRWDRWVARHLVPRPGPWPAGGLRFLLAGAPAMLGVVRPSADRAGRPFPLTLAAPASPAPAEPTASAAGFDDLAGAAAARLDADALETRLAALPCPGTPPETPAAFRLLLWVSARPPAAVDPAAPDAALDRLLGVEPG